MVKDCTVAEQHPATQGHFPGHPVVPGAYLIALIEALVREDVPGARLTALRKVKFLKPLTPGEKAQLEYECDAGRMKFVIRAGGEKCIDGSAVLTVDEAWNP